MCIKRAVTQQFKEILIASGLRHFFPLDEFTRSATVIANGIDNTLNMTKTDDRIVVENLGHLCHDDSRNWQACFTKKVC